MRVDTHQITPLPNMTNMRRKVSCSSFVERDENVLSMYLYVKVPFPIWDVYRENIIITRMHSSRMRTARALTVSHSMLAGGGCLLLGGSAAGGCLFEGCLLPGCEDPPPR